jgi:hybrid cluster-associated redox disulfide protein
MDSRKVNDDVGMELSEKQDDNTDSNISEKFDFDMVEPKKPEKIPSGRPISKNMLITEVVDEHPDIIPEIMNRGMHCVGCGASAFETLEEGFMMHGMEPDEVDKTVEELNKIIEQNSKPERRPEDLDDFY